MRPGDATIQRTMSWQFRLLGGYFRMAKMFSRKNGRIDLAKERTDLEKLGDLFKPLAPIQYTKADADGVPAEWIVPSGTPGDRTILFLHGGSYTTGSISSYRSLAANIALAAGARTLIIDYRLAPEHPFPAAVEDGATAYRWIIKDQAEPGKVIIAGDSSGGSLALALAVYLRDKGDPLPAGLVSIAPMTDLLMTGDTWSSNAKSDVVIYPHKERAFARMYLGGADAKNPYASPLYADLRGLPPIFIQVGAPEVLLSDSTRLAQRAREAGVEIMVEQWEGMQHDWHFTASFVPEGREAIARIGEFIKQKC
jgi:epsilon-lactone hydrolase